MSEKVQEKRKLCGYIHLQECNNCVIRYYYGFWEMEIFQFIIASHEKLHITFKNFPRESQNLFKY